MHNHPGGQWPPLHWLRFRFYCYGLGLLLSPHSGLFYGPSFTSRCFYPTGRSARIQYAVGINGLDFDCTHYGKLGLICRTRAFPYHIILFCREAALFPQIWPLPPPCVPAFMERLWFSARRTKSNHLELILIFIHISPNIIKCVYIYSIIPSFLSNLLEYPLFLWNFKNTLDLLQNFVIICNTGIAFKIVFDILILLQTVCRES